MCGVASRRKADSFIAAGKITINDHTENNLGNVIDIEKDVVRLEGRIITPESKRYLILNKPSLYLTSLGKEGNKKTVRELIAEVPERVYPVGRLDYDVEGLLILTNDGELANKILHPSYEVTKVYRANIIGSVSDGTIAQMKKGIELRDGLAKPDSIRIKKRSKDSSIALVSFHEGRNHLVKRFFAKFGHPVAKLKRVSVGPIRLGNLPSSKWRDLKANEFCSLSQAVGIET